jgi:multiple antibiotic resistance protein
VSQAEAITAFVALFIVIDPIGLAPLFIALTRGHTQSARLKIGLRALAVSAALLLVFGLAGDMVLSFLGISLPAFRIAGGILLFLTALDMLFDRRTKRRSDQAGGSSDHDPSIFPLAMPLIAGPGAIATMILLTGQAGGNALYITQIMLVAGAVLLVVLALFAMAAPMERILGPVGINVVTRLLGMLLAALSVQLVLDGLLEIWPA